MKYRQPSICLVLSIVGVLNGAAAAVFLLASISGHPELLVAAVGAGGGMLACWIGGAALEMLARTEFNTAVLVQLANKDKPPVEPLGLLAAPPPQKEKGPGFVQATRLAARAVELARREEADAAWKRAQFGE